MVRTASQPDDVRPLDQPRLEQKSGGHIRRRSQRNDKKVVRPVGQDPFGEVFGGWIPSWPAGAGQPSAGALVAGNPFRGPQRIENPPDLGVARLHAFLGRLLGAVGERRGIDRLERNLLGREKRVGERELIVDRVPCIGVEQDADLPGWHRHARILRGPAQNGGGGEAGRRAGRQ